MAQQVVLTPQVIEQIRLQTKQEWRKCKRKQYNIFACKVPEGYVFANCLEQPESYQMIRKNFGTDFVHISKISGNTQLVDFLKTHDFYKSDGTRIVLMWAGGALWDVSPEKFAASYCSISGKPISDMKEGEWVEVSRAAESTASAVGIQLPVDIIGIYQTSWATLTVNNPNSFGHGKGDILVAPLLPNGQPNYADISPTNNEVFSLIYDQSVGDWGLSGLITSSSRVKKLTLSDVKASAVF